MLLRIFALLAVAAISGLAAADGACDCNLGLIARFDFDVKVSRPALTSGSPADAMPRYLTLFWAGRLFGPKIFANKSCGRAVYIDGPVWQATTTGDALAIGAETANVAPSGRVAELDYLITGEVTGDATSYTVLARIEAAWSREVVKSASYTFPIPVGGVWVPDPNYPSWLMFKTTAESETFEQLQKAADVLAGQLGPLPVVITEWEKKKRGENTSIARSNPDGTLTLTAAKTNLKEGESTEVELLLTDCDGVPLKQREVHFQAGEWEIVGKLPSTTNGRVDPPVVVTDDEGKAGVRFTAGSRRGAAEINAWYAHHRPNGRPWAILGRLAVNVDGPPLFEVSVTVQKEMTFRQDLREHLATSPNWNSVRVTRKTSIQRGEFRWRFITPKLEPFDMLMNIGEEFSSISTYTFESGEVRTYVDGEMVSAELVSVTGHISPQFRPEWFMLVRFSDVGPFSFGRGEDLLLGVLNVSFDVESRVRLFYKDGGWIEPPPQRYLVPFPPNYELESSTPGVTWLQLGDAHEILYVKQERTTDPVQGIESEEYDRLTVSIRPVGRQSGPSAAHATGNTANIWVR